MEIDDLGITPAPAAELTDPAPVEEPEAAVTEPVETKPGPDEAAPEPEAGEPSDTEPKPQKGVEKRIAELTRARREAERRAAYLEGILSQQKQPEQAPAQTELPSTRPMPKLEDFDYDSDRHVAAVAKWAVEEERARETQQRQISERQFAEQRFHQEFTARTQQTVEKGTAKYPDFYEAVDAIPADVMDVTFAAAVLETESPEDVAYFLAKNQTEAVRISKLSPLRKAVELGKIEERMKTGKPSPKTPSTAPPPVTPVRQKEPAVMSDADLASKDTDAWIKKRNAELRKEGRL